MKIGKNENDTQRQDNRNMNNEVEREEQANERNDD